MYPADLTRVISRFINRVQDVDGVVLGRVKPEGLVGTKADGVENGAVGETAAFDESAEIGRRNRPRRQRGTGRPHRLVDLGLASEHHVPNT